MFMLGNAQKRVGRTGMRIGGRRLEDRRVSGGLFMLRRMGLMFRIGEWGSSYPTEGLAFAVFVESM
jgi:hypothetical protein